MSTKIAQYFNLTLFKFRAVLFGIVAGYAIIPCAVFAVRHQTHQH